MGHHNNLLFIYYHKPRQVQKRHITDVGYTALQSNPLWKTSLMTTEKPALKNGLFNLKPHFLQLNGTAFLTKHQVPPQGHAHSSGSHPFVYYTITTDYHIVAASSPILSCILCHDGTIAITAVLVLLCLTHPQYETVACICSSSTVCISTWMNKCITHYTDCTNTCINSHHRHMETTTSVSETQENNNILCKHINVLCFSHESEHKYSCTNMHDTIFNNALFFFFLALKKKLCHPTPFFKVRKESRLYRTHWC